MVQGNYWCVQSYREQPVSQLIDLLDTYMKRFESLPTAETAEDHHGGIIVNERLVLESELQIKTLGKALLPFSWENLPSLLARVADRMGYRRTEEIWHSPSGSMRRYRLSPSEILLLQRSDDYRFMEETLLLEKDILYTLTLHRFASALQPPTFKDPLPRQNALWNTVERQLLLMETVSRFCLPSLTTRVCPACLEEKYVYERLYWNIRPVLICPHHHLFLVDRCPKCHWLIPAIRRTALWECSYCNRGDYRSAKRTTLSHDSLQYQSQLMFLHELGVDEPLSKNIPSLFQNSSLKSLQPWEYFDVFNCFGSVAPYLRPERTLTSLCRLFGLPDESSLSQGLEHHRTALQISLFHALFVSWPDHVYETLYGAFSLSHSKHQDRDLHLLDEQNEHLSATLKHLFLEAQTIYAQQAFQRNVMRAGNQRKTE